MRPKEEITAAIVAVALFAWFAWSCTGAATLSPFSFWNITRWFLEVIA